MQQQRTVYSNQRESGASGVVTVAAFGMQRQASPGLSVAETLRNLGLAPEPYQSVRVNAQEVGDLAGVTLKANDTVTITNVIAGGHLSGNGSFDSICL